MTRRAKPLPKGIGSKRYGKITRLKDMCKVMGVECPLNEKELKEFSHLELDQVRNLILQYEGYSQQLTDYIVDRGSQKHSRKRRVDSPRYSKIYVPSLPIFPASKTTGFGFKQGS